VSLTSCGGRDSGKTPPPSQVNPPNSQESGQNGQPPAVVPDNKTPAENLVEISEAESGNQYISALNVDGQIAEVKLIGLPKNLVMPIGEGPDGIMIGLKMKGRDGQDIPGTGYDFVGYHTATGKIKVDLKADQEKVLFFNFFINKSGSANVPEGQIQFCIIRSTPENIEINTRAHALITARYTYKSIAEDIHKLAHEKDAAWFEVFKAAYLHRMDHSGTILIGQVLEFAKSVANKANGAAWFALYEAAFSTFAAHDGIADHEAEKLANLAADRNFNAPALLENYVYFKNLTKYIKVNDALAFAEKILSSENVAETSSLTKEVMSFYVDNHVDVIATGKIIEFANRFTEGGNDRQKFELYKETYSYFASIMPGQAEKNLYAGGFTDMAIDNPEPRKWLKVFSQTFESLKPTMPKWEDKVNAAAKAADQAYPPKD
jgi:hypothetical protein